MNTATVNKLPLTTAVIIRTILMTVLVFLPIVFSSCSPAGARFAVLEGNFLYRGAQYKDAVAAYSRAAGLPATSPYAAYGLGLVYLALGESEAAFGRFSAAAEAAASDSGMSELAYRAFYNAGITRFRAGDYEGAVEEFRRALDQDGSRSDAKRNLELGLRMATRKTVPASSLAELGKAKAGTEPKTLFNFLREKEGDRWRNQEWSAEIADTPDY